MIPSALADQVYQCIRCGLCMTTCPVYRQLYFEAAAPRGKVQLIKKIIEGKTEPSPAFFDLLSTCLLCETCTVNCPSGVQLDRLMKAMRAELVARFNLPWQKRAAFALLCHQQLLPFSLAMGRRLENPLRRLLPPSAKAGTIAVDKLPRLNATPLRDQFPEVIAPEGERAGRVAYFTGCATHYVFESVGRATIQVLGRLGIEVIVPKSQMCCGFPILMAGARATALNNIRHNIDLFGALEVDAVIVDCPTCGTALKKEIPAALEEMGQDTARARQLAAKVLDISQYLARFDLAPLLAPVSGKITYHDPCHLARSQGVRAEPRRLLGQVPDLQLVEMAGADVCCGGGGTFQIDHPEVAEGITAKKIAAIRATGAGMVATGCPGCRLQIQGNLGQAPVRVVHPVELVAAAMGHVEAMAMAKVKVKAEV